MEALLAYEEDIIVGVFIDEPMAIKWVEEKGEREVYTLPILDKTFAAMAVENNNKLVDNRSTVVHNTPYEQ